MKNINNDFTMQIWVLAEFSGIFVASFIIVF